MPAAPGPADHCPSHRHWYIGIGAVAGAQQHGEQPVEEFALIMVWCACTWHEEGVKRFWYWEATLRWRWKTSLIMEWNPFTVFR